MTTEEIKNKISLTAEQQEIVNEFNNLFKKMSEAHIEILFDKSAYSFSAINTQHIAELLEDFYAFGNKDAVDIENAIEWNKVHFYLFDYFSSDGNLHAIFTN